MGKQEIPVAIVCVLASAAMVIFVLAGGEGPWRAEVTVFEEDALPSEYMPRDEREHERDEAEYAAFIEERMRRLGEGRNLTN